MTTASASTSTNSPHLLGWWSGAASFAPNGQNTSIIFDRSGNGNHLSWQFTPDWITGQTSRFPVRDSTMEIESSTLQDPNSNATTGGTRPKFRQTDGQTQTDGTITWTSRNVAFSIANNKYSVSTAANNKSVLHTRVPIGYPDIQCPTAKDGVKYTATTISFAAQTISDSANGLGVFGVGDWVLVSGAAAANNNQFGQVQTASAGSLTFTAPFGPNTVAAAGASITITKVLPPWGWMSAFWINTAITTGQLLVPIMETHWGAARGCRLSILGSSSRLIQILIGDTATGATTTVSSGVTIPSGVDTHVIAHVDRARGLFTVFINGVQSAQVSMTAGCFVDSRASAPTTQIPMFGMFTSFNALSGATTWWQHHFYAGPNMPQLTQAQATAIMNDTPLSITDWP